MLFLSVCLSVYVFNLQPTEGMFLPVKDARSNNRGGRRASTIMTTRGAAQPDIQERCQSCGPAEWKIM